LLDDEVGVIDAEKPVVTQEDEEVENSVVDVAVTTCNTAPVPSLDVLIAADAEMPELSIVDTAMSYP